MLRPWLISPNAVLFVNEGPGAHTRVLSKYKLPSNKLITEEGDTINSPELNAAPKILFANEQGNAAFASNLKNQKILKKLNDFLSRNPAYPVMVDNGRYSPYMLTLPNVQIYSGLNSPDDMYIVGTTQYKYGGKLSHYENYKKH